MVRLPDGRSFGPADIDVIKTWAAEGRVPANASLDPVGPGEAVVAGEHPVLRGAINAPPTAVPAPSGPSPCPDCRYDRSGAPGLACPECGSERPPLPPVPANATGGLIPYHNPMALASYYTAIGSGLAMFMPLVGPICSIVAIVLSVKGMKAYRDHPARRGITHAWVGMVGGVLTLLFGLLVTLAVVVPLVAALF
ncbi:MAG: hypothetical protein DHS20C14_11860 [Phycisphaeraceae bacterium]|nr:MAG: hypothetical protein DHS20C14_11860 [Phycisphaeraceae bacterium]